MLDYTFSLLYISRPWTPRTESEGGEMTNQQTQTGLRSEEIRVTLDDMAREARAAVREVPHFETTRFEDGYSTRTVKGHAVTAWVRHNEDTCRWSLNGKRIAYAKLLVALS